MRKKITIIATCSLAAITVIASASLMKKDSNNTTNKKHVAAEQQTEQETAVIGITNITSVGATLDVTDENLTAGLEGQATGQVSLYNTGFASTMDTYNTSITEEEKHDLIKDLDLVTEVVPEGSIIDGYTNLGISNVTSYLNVRKGAGTNYKIVGKMPGYSVCEIISDEGEWYKIKSGSVTGYVSKEFILTGYDANVKAQEKMTEVLVVTCDKLNVREEPSTDCSISTKVSVGEHLDIVEKEKDGWYKASINGLTGYVSADYVEVVYSLPTAVEVVEVQVSGSSSSSRPTYSNLDPNVSQTAKDLINTGMQYLGNPYRYGGNSLTKGIDCSGFVKQIFAKYGYSLPRTSGGYTSVGTRVPLDQIKPGDILIYKYGSRIGHVAIYIGNGQILHAANERDGICISNAYFIYPYMAVRVIP
ncbi:MAG: NlpC/P60 family protein [Lachnospiraceae bacterium]|nr:NlpC/P60 family protein [Lachnospiraceae bacterium]MEE0862239.1 NlpC/P60 family protein [Lachnospiraceae bacterium]